LIYGPSRARDGKVDVVYSDAMRSQKQSSCEIHQAGEKFFFSLIKGKSHSGGKSFELIYAKMACGRFSGDVGIACWSGQHGTIIELRLDLSSINF
jgi:hypothetical protein